MIAANTLIYQASIKSIEKLRSNKEVSCLFDKLNEFGDLILVGGAIRDFTFLNSPRDIDLIIDTDRVDLESVFYNFSYYRNRFGGYKVTIGSIEFDVWSINNNWVFKQGILPARFDNISKGTFFNFDALVFNISTSELDADIFIESIKDNVLDITLNDDYISQNPTPEVNVMRALTIRKQWGLNFSRRVGDYIQEWYEKNESPFETLKKAEYKHYRMNRLLKDDLFFNDIRD